MSCCIAQGCGVVTFESEDAAKKRKKSSASSVADETTILNSARFLRIFFSTPRSTSELRLRS